MWIVIVNAIVAGLIAAAGSIMAAAIEGGTVLPSKGAWIVAACVFVMSAGKDWQSHITIPPPKVLASGLAILLATVLLSGCVSPAMLEALAKDQATFCGQISTVYGTVKVARTNIQNGDVTCDGLKVTTPGSTSVPVTVRPVP